MHIDELESQIYTRIVSRWNRNSAKSDIARISGHRNRKRRAPSVARQEGARRLVGNHIIRPESPAAKPQASPREICLDFLR